MIFADLLQNSIKAHNSFLCAGFDPRLDNLPECILSEARKEKSNEDSIYKALVDFHSLALDACADCIACVKPNIGFYECLGIAGLKALQTIAKLIKEHNLPLILDGKRGDIGSTATAYSSAFLGQASAFGQKTGLIDADALTVNPFLGFDTMEPFLNDCKEYGKGIFVLVKTSNPGSAAIQDCVTDGITISEKIATWAAEAGEALKGECGYSGLGVVVGATYPEQAVKLRKIMPDNFFLIPGLSAQGAAAKDAVAGFSTKSPRGGAVANVSRGLLGKFSSPNLTKEELKAEIRAKAEEYNQLIAAAL